MNSASDLRLCEIVSTKVLTVAPEAPLAEAIQQFAENRLSSLVVVENSKPVGIITERDLLHLICDGMADKHQVRDVMSRPLLTERFDLDFSAAQLMMSNRAVRHLILVDAAGDLKGVASESDFRRHLEFDTYRAIQSLNVVIDQGVELIAPEQTLAAALHAMASRLLDYVLIGRDGRAEGIFTERDIPRLLVCQLDPAAVSVGEFMAKPLRTIAHDLSVAEAAREMEQSGLRHLVVLDSGRVAGVLNQHRLLERLGIVLVEESRQQLENHLGLVLDATGVGSWEYDHQREIVIRSAGFNKLFNFASDRVYETLGDVLARVDPEDRDYVAASFRDLQAAKVEKFSIDYRIRDGDGEMRWVSSRGHVFERDAEGRPLRSVGVVIDIQQKKAAAQQLRQSETRFRNLMENLPLPVGYLNEREDIIFINQHFTEIFGYVIQEVPDAQTWAGLAYPDENYRAWASQAWHESLRLAAESNGAIRPVDYRVRCKDGSTRIAEISGITLGEGILVIFSDVTERRQQQALLEFGNAILQHISIGAPLADVLNFIACEIENQEPATHCSVLVLDESGQHLHHGAAPSLPHEYCAAIDGVAIGPTVGSCGTAAYLAEVVFVADIATDPLWENYKELALQHGLAACWSSPILSTAGKVLGTFAVYWTTPYPVLSPIIQRYVETAAALAAIAIEGAQRDAAEQRMIEELRRWQQLTLGREGRVLELKREVNALRARLGEAPCYGSVAGESR